MDTEPNCKHNRVPRNCYLCYMHRHEYDPTKKTTMDTLHETLSELKIRIAKLEEYKRLQDDENKTNNRLFARFNEDIKNHAEAITKLDSWIDALDHDCGSAHEKIIKLEELAKERAHLINYKSYLDLGDRIAILEREIVDIKIYSHPMQEKVWQQNISTRIEQLEQTNQQAIDANPIKDIYERFTEIDRQLKNQGDINVVLLDKFKSVIKNEIVKTRECMVTTPIKTTGLTFEEAITAFKAGKKIRFHDGMSESSIYIPNNNHGYGFCYSKIIRDHWEIIE